LIEENAVETVRPWYARLLQCVKGYIIKPKKFVSHYYRCKHIMVRGNPAALLWINHKAKKIWKKYCSKEGKYKKAHKEASVAYHKKHHKKK